jgi:hypothetical protein
MTLAELTTINQLVTTGIQQLDTFLACYVGPHGVDPGTVKPQVKLLRAHMITAVASRYAAYNVTGEIGEIVDMKFRRVPEMQDISRKLITDFQRVEYDLRVESGYFKDAKREPQKFDELTPVKDTYDALARFARVVDIMDIVYDANEPTRVRARQAIMNLVSIANVPTPDNVRAAGKDASTLLKKLVILDNFALAYRKAIGDRLACVQANESAAKGGSVDTRCKPIKEEWKYWDGLIDEACTRIEKFGNKTKHTCLPFEYN